MEDHSLYFYLKDICIELEVLVIVKTLIIIPVNGYINRLRAIASAFHLSDELGIPLKIYWKTEDIARTSYLEIFEDSFIESYFITTNNFKEDSDFDLDSIQPYLNIHRNHKIITLAGFDKGEQFFIPEIVELLKDPVYYEYQLIIKAGGKFALELNEDFDLARSAFYRHIKFNVSILNYVDTISLPDSYIGLHLRTTDRSLTAPSNRQLIQGCLSLSKYLAVKNIFVCSDDLSYAEQISTLLIKNNLHVFSSNAAVVDRSNSSSAFFAITDWIILSGSTATVYHGESSFSQEAKLLNKNPDLSMDLVAPGYLQFIRGGKYLIYRSGEKLKLFFR